MERNNESGARRARAQVAGVIALVTAAACTGSPSSDAGVECTAPSYTREPDPDGLREHCRARVDAECLRAFADCPDLGVYAVEYASLADCRQTAANELCTVTARDEVSVVDEAEAESCLAAIPDATCAELEGENGLEACAHVSVLLPPDPASCTIVTEGEITVPVDDETHAFWGNTVGLACTCADEGDTLTFDLDHGGIDSPYLRLFDPDGTEIAQDVGREHLEAELPATGSYLLLIGDSSGSPDAAEVTGTLSFD
jgi:hypothetical protein